MSAFVIKHSQNALAQRQQTRTAECGRVVMEDGWKPRDQPQTCQRLSLTRQSSQRCGKQATQLHILGPSPENPSCAGSRQ